MVTDEVMFQQYAVLEEGWRIWESGTCIFNFCNLDAYSLIVNMGLQS